MGCSVTSNEETQLKTTEETNTVITPEKVVFIAGFDQGKNRYYDNAMQYFQQQNIKIVTDKYALSEIVTWLNTNAKNKQSFTEIHIVSHSNAWLGMSIKTTPQGERITMETLQEDVNKNRIKILEQVITKDTKIVFHACGLGANMPLLEQLKNVFTNGEVPQVYASTYFNVFGGKYAGHYLAKPYYAYYPTAQSPGPQGMAAQFKKHYPNEKINWFNAIKTRNENTLGGVYSYKFNVPIEWDITFDSKEDIPVLDDKEAIMDWIAEAPEFAETLYKLMIPMEQFRWKTSIQGTTLRIRGKTTVLCVLQPLLEPDDSTEYRKANLDDAFLYQSL